MINKSTEMDLRRGFRSIPDKSPKFRNKLFLDLLCFFEFLIDKILPRIGHHRYLWTFESVLGDDCHLSSRPSEYD